MVGAAVVDHDDLVVVGQLARGHVRDDRQAGDGPGVVVGGEEDAEAGLSALMGRSMPKRGKLARALAEGQTRAGGHGAAARRTRPKSGDEEALREAAGGVREHDAVVAPAEHDAEPVAVDPHHPRGRAVDARRPARVVALADDEQARARRPHDHAPAGGAGDVGRRGAAAGRQHDAGPVLLGRERLAPRVDAEPGRRAQQVEYAGLSATSRSDSTTAAGPIPPRTSNRVTRGVTAAATSRASSLA